MTYTVHKLSIDEGAYSAVSAGYQGSFHVMERITYPDNTLKRDVVKFLDDIKVGDRAYFTSINGSYLVTSTIREVLPQFDPNVVSFKTQTSTYKVEQTL
jgi:hypothetical protein